MLVSPLPPSLLETYSLSTSYLGCKALFMVIIFLVVWSICLNSYLVHFKNSPEYLTEGTNQVFISLTRFLLLSFVTSNFLVLLRYVFVIFSFILTCLMVSASNIPKHLYASFSSSVQITTWLLLVSGCWVASPIFPLIVGRIFFSLFWNVLFCLYCFVFTRYLFSLPTFASIFWLVFSSFIFRTSFRDFSDSFEYLLMFRFSILACCRSLLICDSSLSSFPGFDILSMVFKRTPIFSHTYFAPPYIRSLNSVMSLFYSEGFSYQR